jgi:hypothetical protein
MPAFIAMARAPSRVSKPKMLKGAIDLAIIFRNGDNPVFTELNEGPPGILRSWRAFRGEQAVSACGLQGKPSKFDAEKSTPRLHSQGKAIRYGWLRHPRAIGYHPQP